MELVFIAISLAWCLCGVASRDVIIYDDEAFLTSHSILYNYLEFVSGIGQLDKRKYSNTSLSLMEFNQRVYDNVFLLLSKPLRFANKLTLKNFLDHVDTGGNLIISSEVSSTKGEISKLVNELGFITGAHSTVIDHSNYIVSNENDGNKHTTVVINPRFACNSIGVFPTTPTSMLYEGTGFAIDRSNPLTFAILTASSSAYVADPESPITEFPLSIGKEVVLIGATQTRCQSRATVIGSYKFFSDKFLSHTSSPLYSTFNNYVTMKNTIRWTYQKQGVLRITNPKHVLVSSGQTLSQYLVDNLIEYSFTMEELDVNGKWIPYVTGDVQIELVRLTTFARITPNYTGAGGVYSAQFYTPDFIGTYSIETRYRRPGFTNLNHHVKIIIRPRRHNDYQRFLPGAWPYYSVSFLMMFLCFCLVFMFLNNHQEVQKTKKC